MTTKKPFFTRRELLEILGATGAYLYLAPDLKAAETTAAANNKFLIHIHAGSWDSWSSGLLQPVFTANGPKFPKGVFVDGQDNVSLNPNVNKFYNYEKLVFNNYTRTLLPIADHMCFAVGNPISLGHPRAATIQKTGFDELQGQSSWVNAFAHMLSVGTPSLVCGPVGSRMLQMSATASNIAIVDALDKQAFEDAFKDKQGLPNGDYAKAFWNVSKKIVDDDSFNFKFSKSFRQNYNLFIDNLVDGPGPLGEYFTSISTTLNAEAIKRTIDTDIGVGNDGEGVKTYFHEPLMKALQLAGVLAKSGLAKGMAIEHHGDDNHFGRQLGNQSGVLGTARRGADMFVQLRLFWQWIKSQNLQNDVMIVITQDFSRTAYNSDKAPAPVTFKANGQDVTITALGTDHHLVMSTIFINGNVPRAGRLGGVGDGYVALASDNLSNGLGVVGSKAYTAAEIISTMFLRCFPDIFRDHRELRQIWPKMPNPIDLLLK